MDPTSSNINSFVESLRKTMEEKCLKPMRTLDNLVTRNLHNARIKTRPARSNGLWCFALLPTALVLNNLLYDVPQAYKLAACVSAGLFFYGIFFNMFISVTYLVLTEDWGAGSLVSGVITSALVYNVVKPDIILVVISALPSAFIYSTLLRTLLMCPSTFTIGEAIVVAQSIVIAVTVTVAKVTCDLGDASTEVDIVNAVVFTVLSTVGLIVTALYWLKEDVRTVKQLIYILLAAAAFALVQIHLALGFDSLIKIITFLFMDKTRTTLLAFWLSLVAAAVAAVAWRTWRARKAASGARKLFHVLAALVFAAGLLKDLELMEMAAGVGLGVLLLVEALRKSNIQPISSALQSAFLVYGDEKDCGSFALTPLYMYCGLGAGLLAPRGAPALERLSGVLAVGVGDAAASCLGSRYGVHKWPGQNRTVEGTLSNILSQVLTVYCLGLFEFLDCKHAVLRTTVAGTVTSLVEANTDQVDNLILPLVTLIAFQATYFIS